MFISDTQNTTNDPSSLRSCSIVSQLTFLSVEMIIIAQLPI